MFGGFRPGPPRPPNSTISGRPTKTCIKNRSVREGTPGENYRPGFPDIFDRSRAARTSILHETSSARRPSGSCVVWESGRHEGLFLFWLVCSGSPEFLIFRHAAGFLIPLCLPGHFNKSALGSGRNLGLFLLLLACSGSPAEIGFLFFFSLVCSGSPADMRACFCFWLVCSGSPDFLLSSSCCRTHTQRLRTCRERSSVLNTRCYFPAWTMSAF